MAMELQKVKIQLYMFDVEYGLLASSGCKLEI